MALSFLQNALSNLGNSLETTFTKGVDFLSKTVGTKLESAVSAVEKAVPATKVVTGAAEQIVHQSVQAVSQTASVGVKAVNTVQSVATNVVQAGSQAATQTVAAAQSAVSGVQAAIVTPNVANSTSVPALEPAQQTVTPMAGIPQSQEIIAPEIPQNTPTTPTQTTKEAIISNIQPATTSTTPPNQVTIDSIRPF